MPYFSTKPIFADYYAAFNDNDLMEAPLDDPDRIARLRTQAAKRQQTYEKVQKKANRRQKNVKVRDVVH